MSDANYGDSGVVNYGSADARSCGETLECGREVLCFADQAQGGGFQPGSELGPCLHRRARAVLPDAVIRYGATSRKKRRAKLVALRKQCWIRRHDPVPEQHAWLSSVLTGHFRYFGVPTNSRNLHRFKRVTEKFWHRALQRHSQKARWTVKQLQAFEQRFPLPEPRIHHPWPERRFAAR